MPERPIRDLFAEAAEREKNRIMRESTLTALLIAAIVTGLYVIAWGPNLRKGLQ